MPDVPTQEPRELRNGDTWKWRREDLSDYPAPTWALRYYFKNATSHFEIVSAADGVNHAVTVDSVTTGGYTAGAYNWVAYVELVGSSPVERYQVDQGTFRALPSFANASPLDTRSHARKVYEAICAVLERRATMDQEEYKIGDRELKRTPLPELVRLKQQYGTAVQAELAAEGLANGHRPANSLRVRF